MKIVLIAAGRAKGGPEAKLAAEYAKRLPWRLAVIEIEEKRGGSAAEQKAREGKKLLAAVPKGAFVVALERTGKAPSSEAFAGEIRKWEMDGHKTVAFIIGGAEGLADAVLAAARFKLSFGTMTWPHLLARVMLLEQLYRAHAILAGHPYHK
jgi:23S rRNA (pseudouridine1915-N3)-methyltransferase